ncbi:MAG: tetratricopeptide repeat protein [Elusimicrobiota bacterium]
MIIEQYMRKSSLFIFLNLCFISLLYSSARTLISKGNNAYNGEKYDVALENYHLAESKKPGSCEVPFNLGNVYYKTDNYEEAIKNYERTTYSKDIKLQQKSYYNIGNALFRSEKLSEAIQFYKKALELEPDDNDAKFNLEFTQKKMKEKNDKKSKQEQDKKNQKKEDKKEKKKNDSEKKEEQQKGMSKEDAKRLLNTLPEEKKPKEKSNMKIPLFNMPDKDW